VQDFLKSPTSQASWVLIFKMKEYKQSPEEIEARKAMYQYVLEAQRCIPNLDTDRFNDCISLAQFAAYGYSEAAMLLELYIEGHNGLRGLKREFVNKAYNLAFSCAEKGDVENTRMYLDKIDAIDYWAEEDMERIRDELIDTAEAVRRSKAKTKRMPAVELEEISLQAS